MEILNVENLSFKYPLSDTFAVENISFSVKKGDFIILCGAKGSGKSTLLRLLKKELMPNGKISGKIEYKISDSPSDIGYVGQYPEESVVTDKVWHELAFGLENMGIDSQFMRTHVFETASYFGFEEIFESPTSELSGGQKQLLSLSSVCAMQPQVIILDEPTAHLDPISTEKFAQTLQKLNKDFGITVILAEHNTEHFFSLSTHILALQTKQLFFEETKKGAVLLKNYPDVLCDCPFSVRFFNSFDVKDNCPFDTKEAKEFIINHFDNKKILSKKDCEFSSSPVLDIKNISFRYRKDSSDILTDVSLRLHKQEILCLLGGNGSGKTTLLSLISGLNKTYTGKIKILDKPISSYKNNSLYKYTLSMLPQNITSLFIKDTVREELGDNYEPQKGVFDFSHLLDKHPYDLSGGERQLLGLYKVLKNSPEILLLDEPTQGLDMKSKKELIKLLNSLKKDGLSILAVTHDIEFASEISDSCAFLFNKTLTESVPTRRFFSENYFYTTRARCATRGYFDGVITLDDAVEICKLNGEKNG